MLRPSTVFAQLERGETVYGLLNSLASPLLCEMIGHAGYDFVILDLEHLLRDGDELMHCLRACEAAGLAPWVRVPEVDDKLIGRLLDAGAEAIVLPRVESAAEVARAVAAAQFPPQGRRGISGGRNTGFGALALADYIALSNRQPRIVPMIESAAGLAALPQILAVPGLAMVLEGALDLALDLGVGPAPLHPQVWQALQRMATACAAAGIPFCANPRSPEQHAHWCALGLRSFLAGEDRGLLHQALKARLQTLNPTPIT
ncbi:4-hydroxy-2-oxovalerate aldolase [Pseudomonas lalucatii]|nr:4-hydroxy-2-oxovalerate aldolase [Pseudomonas lalucatii]